MAGETLQRVWTEFLVKAGRATLRAAALALVLGAITFVVAHQGWQVTIESGVLLAVVVAFASFVWLLVLATGRLEKKLGDMTATVDVQNQRIGAHRAIAQWVRGCEISLEDTGSGLSREDRIAQELRQLEANTINSLKYPFYTDGMRAQIRTLAAGDPNQTPADRLEQLLDFLREQLQAGSYLV